MSSNRNSLVWGLVLCYLAAVDCFLPLPLQTRIRVEASRRDVVLDPSALDPNVVDVTIAVVSAAAGAATQVPRIQQLEKDLEGARADLLESEEEMVLKIKTLEDKLFAMDEEFEQQSAKVKKNFDLTLRNEIEKVTTKLKQDYQFSLDIKLEEAKADMLAEKLDFVNNLTGDKQNELSILRLKQEKLKVDNRKLEEALEQSEKHFEQFKKEVSGSKGWWPFN